MFHSIDAITANEWLARGDALLLDVREQEEYAHEHIDGATLIPLGDVSAAKLPPLGNKKLIIHCHLGVRSAHACNRLLADIPGLDVYNLTGGIEAWKAAKLPLCTG